MNRLVRAVLRSLSSRSSLTALVFAAACGRSSPEPSSAESPNRSAAEALQGGNALRDSSSVRISGSSALQPLVNAAKEQFELAYPGASIEVSAGGSRKGLADVASGAVDIGDSDIAAPADLMPKLVEHKVAAMGFATMANRGPFNESIHAVSLERLAQIFKGEVKNWREVGGTDQPIVVINRAPGSGTRTLFGDVVLHGDEFVESQTEDNSGALVAKLKQTKGAISYMALSFEDPALSVLALEIGSAIVVPSEENITSGAYPLWSYEYMFTAGRPTGTTRQFLDYVLSSGFQRQVLPTVKGFIPVVDMRASREGDRGVAHVVR